MRRESTEAMQNSLSLYERILRKLGVEVIGRGGSRRYLQLPDDFDEVHRRIYRRVEPYTMTRPERVYALIEAVRYLVDAGIGGDFVECGVWKGGSIMAMALTLQELGAERELHLFDTFSGMTAPSDDDWNVKQGQASRIFEKKKVSEDAAAWCRSSLDEVRANVLSTNYRPESFYFAEGKVEDTLPGRAPDEIALLRLDTDFYESTRHELVHLYPRLAPGGVLILDDYGHWKGARKAVDEYLSENNISILLNRVDYSGRIAVKPRT